MLHRELLVNGVFLGGVCDGGFGKQVVRSPIDGSVVGTAAEGTWPEADAALDAARAAQSDWRSPAQFPLRAEVLRRVARRIRADRQELADLMTLEIGKPTAQGLAELDRAALTLELSVTAAEELILAGESPADVAADPRSAQFEARVRHVPHGTLLAVTPYNWPFNLAAHKLGPALAMGNTVVLKGSPKASLCTLSLARIFHEEGVPHGVLNVLNVDDRTAARLTDDPRIDAVSFTGSAGVGWRVRDAAGRRPCVLELGGNAAALVTRTSMPPEAIARDLAVSAFAYAGQVCVSLQHVLVTPELATPLREALIAATVAIPFGDPRTPGTVCGPLIDTAAAERVEALVQASRGEFLAWSPREGNRLPPILVEVPYDAEVDLMRQEAFGPVLTFSVVPSVDDAIRFLDRASGIHASVYTDDDEVVEAVRAQVRVGGVLRNTPPTFRFDALAYGGERESGWGREGVNESVRALSRPQTYVQPRTA